MDFLDGKKAYIAAAGVVLTAVGTFLTGDATLIEAFTAAFTGLGIAGIRHGVAKGG